MKTRLFFLSPPPGVSKEEFDRWYVGVHAQEAKDLPTTARYLSWLGEKVPERLLEPRWERYNRWHRLTELTSWWPAGVPAAPRAAPFTPPTYDTRVEDPPHWWLEESILIGDRPEYDLLRDVPKLS